METQNKTLDQEFHAVEFMREVRGELSRIYLLDKREYLNDLKKAVAEFKQRQEKAHSQQETELHN